jgi:hypothetical protein
MIYLLSFSLFLIQLFCLALFAVVVILFRFIVIISNNRNLSERASEKLNCNLIVKVFVVVVVVGVCCYSIPTNERNFKSGWVLNRWGGVREGL